jgi:hypothetical protein
MSALFGDLVIVDVLLLPLKELWGKMVIAIRHSTGNANAGFLKKVVLDNRQTRAQSQLRLNEDFDLKPTSQITDMANLSARLARESNRPANDHPSPIAWNSTNHDAEFRLGFVRRRDCWISYRDQGWHTAIEGAPEPM